MVEMDPEPKVCVVISSLSGSRSLPTGAGESQPAAVSTIHRRRKAATEHRLPLEAKSSFLFFKVRKSTNRSLVFSGDLPVIVSKFFRYIFGRALNFCWFNIQCFEEVIKLIIQMIAGYNMIAVLQTCF